MSTTTTTSWTAGLAQNLVKNVKVVTSHCALRAGWYCVECSSRSATQKPICGEPRITFNLPHFRDKLAKYINLPTLTLEEAKQQWDEELWNDMAVKHHFHHIQPCSSTTFVYQPEVRQESVLDTMDSDFLDLWRQFKTQ